MIKKILVVFFAVFLFAASIQALNKIRWKEMDWHIYETEHFNIYYYEGAEMLGKMAAIYAEEAYIRDSSALKYKSKSKIPLFIYEDSLDFSSTNITLSYLGEGTGGFTEAFKNRVVLPSNGSFRDLREVVYHEVAHAIQYNILYGEGLRSYNTLYRNMFVPMWVMEGQAEYCADDMDAEGEMVLRDAVINGRLIPINRLNGFAHLDEVFLAYKESQSIFDYISLKYGEDRVYRFIHLMSEELGTADIFFKVLKKPMDEFSEEWEFYLKNRYWAQIQGRDRPEKYGPALTEADHTNIIHNQGPVFSPDGSRIAYISNKGGHRNIFVMRADGKNKSQVFGAPFGRIVTSGFPLSWEDDSTIYFTVAESGKRHIYKGNTENGTMKKIEIPGMYNVYSPAVSPAGGHLAFIGVDKGFSDVYVLNFKTGKVKNLTGNIFKNNSVSWSAGGKYIVFTEERNGYDRVVFYNAKQGERKFLTDSGEYNCRYPKFLSEKKIVYTSDKNGIYNLYSKEIDGHKEKMLTNVISGAFSPDASGSFITYSYYEDACYNIYKLMTGRDRKFVEIPLNYSEKYAGEKKEKKNTKKNVFNNTVIAAASNGGDAEYKKMIDDTFKKILKDRREYTTSFSPDLVLGLLGFSTDTGFMGGGYISLSDMLGNNNLALLANIIPGYYSQVELEYLYMSLPFDVGIRGRYFENIYELYDSETGEFFSRYDTTEWGGSFYLKYPFNIYTGLSLSFGTQVITDEFKDYDTDQEYVFDDGSVITGEKEKKVINKASAMLLYEHSAWRDLWPYSGEYLMAYAGIARKMFGGTRAYNVYEADLRKYIDLSFISDNNMSLCLRGVFAMTEGRDRPYFLVGGAGTLRGVGHGEYKGDKIFLTSVELRYTMLRNLNLRLWPATFVLLKNIKAAFFNDSGIIKKGEIKNLAYEDVKSGFGLSLILDTFILQRQYMPLKFEVAKRSDITDNAWKFYFSVSTGF